MTARARKPVEAAQEAAAASPSVVLGVIEVPPLDVDWDGYEAARVRANDVLDNEDHYLRSDSAFAFLHDDFYEFVKHGLEDEFAEVLAGRFDELEP